MCKVQVKSFSAIGSDKKHLKLCVFKDANEFYKLSSGDVVDELGILFPRLDVQKELEELAKIEQ